jgi:hypothetical protein
MRSLFIRLKWQEEEDEEDILMPNLSLFCGIAVIDNSCTVCVFEMFASVVIVIKALQDN